MTSNEIRKSFLDFFAGKEHRILDNATVVPYGDPTLLFINAGMNQFKDVFLGTGTRDYKRAANTQKCIRVSGKHNDLEEVGVDTYHHTLFEMLGNWSFGDYYKSEAIDWAWELLTKVWKLEPARLYATVYRSDDEAYKLWEKYLPANHILRFDEKDNFWEMGNTGPCGPCSEVHYDRTDDLSGANLVNTGSPDVIEIWNLVFIQFNRKPDGNLEPLKDKFIDTGMGFERICSILQNVKSNYDTDIFVPLLKKIEELSDIKYEKDIHSKENISNENNFNEKNNATKNDIIKNDAIKNNIAMRVIADHVRALSFAIADGALPGNEGRSYVLRRILRRALRYSRSLGFKEPVIYKLVQTLTDTMGNYFKELVTHQKTIEKVIKTEEESFLQTMERGLEQLDNIIKDLKNKNLHTVRGEDAFLLYDTFGFPLDLTELIARENGFTVDIQGFDEKMNEQKERSRAARKQTSQEIVIPSFTEKTEFVGYENFEIETKIIFAENNMIVLSQTPFYAESGGQVSDTGFIILNSENLSFGNSSSKKNTTNSEKINVIDVNVIDVKKVGNTIFHIIENENSKNHNLKIGDTVIAKVNVENRRNIMRNHTATHLLHEALRLTLGEHLYQSGSLVTADYLRFDFNHFEKVSADKIKEIEKIVNDIILAQIPIQTNIYSLDEAKKNPKIKMFFGDKYGDEVRAVTVGDFSLELCGGTHCKNSSEVAFFKIISESSIAAGIRRIEAITGKAAFEFVMNLEKQLQEKSVEVESLKSKIKHFEKLAEKLKKSQLGISLTGSKNINGIRVLVVQMELENLDQLRTTAENARETFGTNGIFLVASIIEDKVQLSCSVTDDLKDKYPAGKLVGEAAKVLGGSGGGKPHLATAGGRDISKLNDLLETKFYKIVKEF